MNPIISQNNTRLIALFKKNKVKKAYVFGSILTEKFNDTSDVDFIIDFEENLNPVEKGMFWWELHDELRVLLKKEVDIVNQQKITNPYFLEEINRTKKLIYG
jgi:predicted nucleotidyltransferase